VGQGEKFREFGDCTWPAAPRRIRAGEGPGKTYPGRMRPGLRDWWGYNFHLRGIKASAERSKVKARAEVFMVGTCWTSCQQEARGAGGEVP
jgi:hypothetical protein